MHSMYAKPKELILLMDGDQKELQDSIKSVSLTDILYLVELCMVCCNCAGRQAKIATRGWAAAISSPVPNHRSSGQYALTTFGVAAVVVRRRQAASAMCCRMCQHPSNRYSDVQFMPFDINDHENPLMYYNLSFSEGSLICNQHTSLQSIDCNQSKPESLC